MKNGSCYVDKTVYLNEFFMGSTDAQANIFIRPRRFGKTLNMQMIKSFCELNYQNPGDKSYQEELFLDNGRNLAVSSNSFKNLRDNFIGEFPVIYVSFKDVEGDLFIVAPGKLLGVIYNVYNKFNFITYSTKLLNSLKNYFATALDRCINESENFYYENFLLWFKLLAGSFLAKLASMLYQEYGRHVIILIDENDVLLQKSLVAKEPYYDEMLDIIRDISSQTFKPDGDDWLYTAIVTGCLKIAHQSIFTGANNFKLNGLDDEKYARFFGFTRSETEKLLNDCGLSAQTEAVTDWYDGYRIGNEHMFCPWIVLSFCDKALGSQHSIAPEPFWVNTSGNDIINLYLKNLVNEN
ncbi:MAG: AAA family ATPase, partial [Desulfovibrionaceae bacterium]|nr:AAA family ATPase [Desulfovibrionaceae bacterium]